MEGQTENFTPRDNVTPRGQSSLLGDNLSPEGQSLSIGVKLKIGLIGWFMKIKHCSEAGKV
jgi:hypothetical protein